MTRPFTRLDGVAAPMALANVDTDKIIPAAFLKTVTKQGMGAGLFHMLRFDPEGRERPEFILNRIPWRDACFLVTLENFGCGSSREHAPWALLDFGIRCVIAPSFADIFSNNCVKNGLLPLELPRATCEELLSEVQAPERARLTIDLSSQTLIRGDGAVIAFGILAERKERLLSGRDDIDTTIAWRSSIDAHAAEVRYQRPTIPFELDDFLAAPDTSQRGGIARPLDGA